jgi:hypothetical protein
LALGFSEKRLGRGMKLTDRIARARAYRRIQREHPTPGTTLASKILYKMAWDRNPQLTVFADKVGVRRYISERAGEDFVVPVLTVIERGGTVDFSSLPREFAIKVSHGSGGVIVVSDRADPAAVLPEDPRVGWARFEIHPDQLDPVRVNNLLAHWLGLNFEWWQGRRPEWAYRHVTRRVVIEPLMKNPDGGDLSEYKAFCFDGHAQVIRVDRGRVVGGKTFSHYDREWNQLRATLVETGYAHPIGKVEPRPDFLPEIIRVAELLTQGVDFARVDLIDDSGQLRVGEITNYPTAGNFEFVPPEFSEWFGKDWIPNYRSR